METIDYLKVLNELLDDYSNNPRKGKEYPILSVAKLCPLYVDDSLTEIKENSGLKIYYSVYTKSEDAKANFNILSMLDIVNYINDHNELNKEKYLIDGIIINPKDIGITYSLNELCSYRFLRTTEFIKRISWLKPRRIMKIDQVINDYLSKFNNKVISNIDTDNKYKYIDIKVEPGEIAIIGGRPAMGKTSVAINLMINETLNHDGSIIYFNSQRSTEELIRKIVNEISHIGIIDGIEMSDEEYSKMYACLENIKKLDMYIQDSIFFNIDDIKNTIKSNDGIKPTMIIIDCLQALSVNENQLNSMNTKRAMSELKEIAKQTNTKLIILSELNRSLENRYDMHPRLSDIRGSLQIGELADRVYMIYRDDYYNDDYENHNNSIEVSCLKPNSESITKIYRFNELLGGCIG